MNTAISNESTALLKRIQDVKKQNGLTLISIAKEAGMAQPTVTNQMNGHFNLDIRVVMAVARLCPNVSADYILRGIGDMYSNDTSSLESRISRLEKMIDNKAKIK